MKIYNLTEDSKIYTSNVFLVMGTWNTISDINTLVDVGCDKSILEKIDTINTGLGKKKVDQVILTHSHSDHTALLPLIKEKYNPNILAFNSHLRGIYKSLRDGDMVKIGEQQFEVYHITAHSYDSICLFGEEEGILFAGDTTFPIEFENEILKEENFSALSRLYSKAIKKVYYGHGPVHLFTDKKFKLIKENINSNK
jgi:glyoxylase-like metal-dependent hydrolase (beta-lactamase superfamily II)